MSHSIYCVDIWYDIFYLFNFISLRTFIVHSSLFELNDYLVCLVLLVLDLPFARFLVYLTHKV